MLTRSRKNKGKKLQNYVRDLFRKIGSTYGLIDEDINSAIMGQSGTDIIFTPAAKQVFPFSIECKNQEKINIWASIQQAEDNTKEGRIPMLVFSKNRSKTYAVVELEKLLDILYSK